MRERYSSAGGNSAPKQPALEAPASPAKSPRRPPSKPPVDPAVTAATAATSRRRLGGMGLGGN